MLGLNPVTWEALSERINLFNFEPEKLAETRQLFADTWRGFGYDFLRKEHADEYNAIKHGLRTRKGGSSMAFGLEPSPGVAPPAESMRSGAAISGRRTTCRLRPRRRNPQAGTSARAGSR